MKSHNPHILFIISLGHSGSTLLDMLIGSLPGVFSTGELNYLPWQVYRNIKSSPSRESEDICTCNKSFIDCDVWGSVLRTIRNERSVDTIKRPLDFNISLMTTQIYNPYKKHLTLKATRFFYKKIFHYPGTELFKYFARQVYKNKIDNNLILFNTIKDTFKYEYIVDSTKDIVRLGLLAPSLSRKSVIILIRDLYGYTNSYLNGLGSTHKRNININKIIKEWVQFYNNILRFCELLKLEPIIVSYEDYAMNPNKVRNEIAKHLNIGVSTSIKELDSKKYHIVAGNPMRFKEKIVIKYDEKWKKQLTTEQIEIIKKARKKISSIYSFT